MRHSLLWQSALSILLQSVYHFVLANTLINEGLHNNPIHTIIANNGVHDAGFFLPLPVQSGDGLLVLLKAPC
jgi:hypothetical protein